MPPRRPKIRGNLSKKNPAKIKFLFILLTLLGLIFSIYKIYSRKNLWSGEQKMAVVVQEIAKELEIKIKPNDYIEKVQAQGPYLNFFINKKEFVKQTITAILKQKDKYGSSKNKEKIMIEFSGPNPFKAFHIGHLRNTVLGESLTRVLQFQGYKVLPVNYLNDTGTHVSKCIWGLENLKLKPSGERGEWLGEVYAKADEKIGNDPPRLEQVQEIHKKIEQRDPKYLKAWKQGVKDSIIYFKKIYQDLEVKFNKTYFDSQYISPGKSIVSSLLKKRIAEKSEGAILIDLEKYNLHKVLVLKSDQTSLYITKDLAMAIDRIKKYKIDKLVYITGSEQKLHFQQLFKILELYGFKQARKCYHLSYELVRLPEGRMASRKGKVITYSEIKKELLSKIEKEVDKRHKNWDNKRKGKAIKTIFSSAIKFDLIKQGPEKIIIYSTDKATELEGDTGPYIQYTHARICSILRKEKPSKLTIGDLQTKEENDLVLKLSGFPETVNKAAREYKPHLIANYLIELSRQFNEFYHKIPVLQSKEKQDRLLLIKAVKQVISNGLGLLAIMAPEEM